MTHPEMQLHEAPLRCESILEIFVLNVWRLIPVRYNPAWPTENPIKDEEILLENASKFYQLIRKQGAIPIITASPSSNTTLEFVRKVANKNNVLFIPPVNDYLETYDGYHLSPEGAEVFTNNFLKELDLILSN